MMLKSALIIGGLSVSLTVDAALAQLPPPHTTDNVLLCGLLQVQREFRRAIDHCDAALKSNPADAETLANRGGSHLRLGNLNMALADFNAAIEMKPLDARNFFNRALVYTAKGHHEQAIADYDRALELMPGLAIAYNNRAHEYERVGDRDKAISDYRKALSIDPDLKSVATHNLRRMGVEP